MKMISKFSRASPNQCLTVNELEYSIRRNFGGFPHAMLDTVSFFDKHLKDVKAKMKQNSEDVPPLNPEKMIETCLSGIHTKGYVL